MAIHSTRIRWVRLKECMEAMTCCQVEILATTGMKESHVAHLDLQGNSARVLVNLCVCKDLNAVIKALAHETAHILLRSDVHDDAWKELNAKCRKELVFRYLNAGAEDD